MFYSFQLHPDSYAEWEQMWLIPEIGHLVLAQFHLQACMVKIQCWNKGRVPLAPKYRWKIFLICQEYVLCNQTHLKSWSIRREFKLVEKRTERCFFFFLSLLYVSYHLHSLYSCFPQANNLKRAPPRNFPHWSRKKKVICWSCGKSFVDLAWSFRVAWYLPHSFLRS